MFAAHCEAEGRTVLLSNGRITDLRTEPGRVTIAFTCWCGHEGVVVEHRSPVGHPSAAPSTGSTARRAEVVVVVAEGDPGESLAPVRRPVEAAAAA